MCCQSNAWSFHSGINQPWAAYRQINTSAGGQDGLSDWQVILSVTGELRRNRTLPLCKLGRGETLWLFFFFFPLQNDLLSLKTHTHTPIFPYRVGLISSGAEIKKHILAYWKRDELFLNGWRDKEGITSPCGPHRFTADLNGFTSSQSDATVWNSPAGLLTETSVSLAYMGTKDIEVRDVLQHASPSVPYKEVCELTAPQMDHGSGGRLRFDGWVCRLDLHCN